MKISFNLKFISIFLLSSMAITACHQNNAPDVSGIDVKIHIERFDRYMFENADTGNIARQVAGMQAAFPYFTNDFLNYILGLPAPGQQVADSVATGTYSGLKRFIILTAPLYDSLAPRFKQTDWIENDLSRSFRYVKYYYPAYAIPKIVFFVGPFDAPGVAVTNDALGVGLQLYAGKNFSFYTSMQGQEMFPAYISRKFEPEYIPVNCIKAVAQDIYPDKSSSRPLIEQMVEKGKQWYITRKFMPDAADSLITGFSDRQLKWCEENEASIWNYFLSSNELYATEPTIVKNYIGESPNTQGMPDSSPGNIGQWTGLQIVLKYASKNSALKLDDLLKTEPKKIFAEAKYKPR